MNGLRLALLRFRPLLAFVCLVTVAAGVVVCAAATAIAAEAAAEVTPSFGDMLMQQVVPLAIEAIAAFIVVLLAVWKLRAPQWIGAATDNQLLQAALLFVSDLVRALVRRAQATTVAELNQALKDGRITRDEYRKALAKLKAQILEEVLAQTLGRFKAAGISSGAAQKIVDAKIEAEVPEAKALMRAAKPPMLEVAKLGAGESVPPSPTP